MRLRCRDCKGNGIIEEAQVCPDCQGAGSDRINLGVGESKGDKCPTCKGKENYSVKQNVKTVTMDIISSVIFVVMLLKIKKPMFAKHVKKIQLLSKSYNLLM
ncbi:MAG: hypothetical protein ACXAD7_05575 [Candidatus Kariarchaeaceae archaeon]|jgi:RecJ-like exonuclease